MRGAARHFPDQLRELYVRPGTVPSHVAVLMGTVSGRAGVRGCVEGAAVQEGLRRRGEGAACLLWGRWPHLPPSPSPIAPPPPPPL